MSQYTHFTDMSYTYDPLAAPQFQNYDQFYENVEQPIATGEMQSPMNSTSYYANYDSNDPYANEPPLMEELEINLDQIMQKTWAVLTFKNLDDHKNILHEPDLAGPLVFLLAFGFLLLLTVYLMSPKNLSFMCTVSVLGYCLLPMVILSGLSILINLRANLAGNLISVIAVLWCAIGASNLLVTAIEMSNSRLVVAYPCALFYTVFALLTVF